MQAGRRGGGPRRWATLQGTGRWRRGQKWRLPARRQPNGGRTAAAPAGRSWFGLASPVPDSGSRNTETLFSLAISLILLKDGFYSERADAFVISQTIEIIFLS